MNRGWVAGGALLALPFTAVLAMAQSQDLGPLTLLQALRSTLENNPRVLIEREEMAIARSARRQAAGAFDTTLRNGVSWGREFTPLTSAGRDESGSSAVETRTTGVSLGASRMLRNGVEVGPVLELSRLTGSAVGSAGVNVSRLAFEVKIPLRRGSGRATVAAFETAAAVNAEAAAFDLSQTMADLLAGTAVSYWRQLAAKERLKVALDSERRGQTIVETTQALVDAGRMPSSEIQTAAANVAGRAAARVNAEQALVEASQDLALAAGLGADQLQRLAETTGDFPNGDEFEPPANSQNAVSRWIELALRRRADHVAAKRREEAASALVARAENLTRTQVDLMLSTGYSGLKEGSSLSPLFRSIGAGGGVDAWVGLSLGLPVGNNAALGRLVEARSRRLQAQLSTADIERRITSDVIVALEAVRNTTAQLIKAQESVDAFQKSLAGEREKVRLGIGSLLGVLQVEDRFTGAQIQLVQARFEVAVAIAQFRLASGTILDPTAETQSLDEHLFRAPPRLEP